MSNGIGIKVSAPMNSGNGNISLRGRGSSTGAGLSVSFPITSEAGDINLTARGLFTNFGVGAPISTRSGDITLNVINAGINFGTTRINAPLTSESGNITISSLTVASSKIDTTGGSLTSGVNGTILLQAAGDITTGDITNTGSGGITIISRGPLGTIDTRAGTLNTSSASGTAGAITLSSRGTAGNNNGNIIAGDLISSSPNGDGGRIILNARKDITTGTINAQGGRDGGDIHLTSGTTIDTTGGVLNSIGANRGGSISLNAGSDIVTSDIAILVSGFNADSGNIGLTSTGGNIDTSLGSLAAPAASGNGGNITLDANGSLTVGTIDARSLTQNGGALTLSANDRIGVTTGKVETNNNNITFNRQVNLAGDVAAISRGTGDIIFDGTIDGGHNLQLDAGAGSVRLNGAVGSTSPLNSLQVRSDIVTANPAGVEVTALQDIATQNIAASGGIALASRNGSISTATLDTSSLRDAGDVALSARDITARQINAQAGGRGGNVDISARRFFRATDSFVDRNGIRASISTAGRIDGGTIVIRHGGGGIIPFSVGSARINGTVGAIARGDVPPEQRILPFQEYFETHTQDAGRIQIISTIDPPPQPAAIPSSSPPDAPSLLPEDRGSNPLENLAFLLGDLLGAETQINQTPTGDYQFSWNIQNGRSHLPNPHVLLSLNVPNPGFLNNSLETLDLSQDADSLVADIDKMLEKQVEEYLGENITDKKVTAQSIRDTLQTIERETGTKAVIVYAISDSEEIPEPNELLLVLVRPDGPPLVRTVPEATPKQLGNALYTLKNTLLPSQNTALDPTNEAYLHSAQQLYQWFIAPIASELNDLNIDTLIFSTGLRSIPLAVLHDGEQFLIEKYSLGAIPSFSLTDTSYQTLQQSPVLAMGASEFPDSEQQTSLPAASIEVAAAIPTLRAGKSFLNEDFTLDNLKIQRHNNSFDIIHLATHASFQPLNSDSAYIQFWDEKVGLTGLRKVEWYSGHPVQLLVLSACETALGDKDAELGFAGLAVQAGVKSALASLWKINDAATLPLMAEFYAQLSREDVKIKAEALRQAQLALLRGQVRVESGQLRGSDTAIPLPPELSRWQGSDFSHPYYWAGFTVIGSPW